MADYLTYQHLYKYYLKFAVLLLQLCVGGKLLFFVSLHPDLRRIKRILLDLAANQKSHHLSPHLAGAVDNGDVKLYPCLSDKQQCFPYWMQQIEIWAGDQTQPDY